MTRDETVIQTLALINTLIGEKAFSEAWTSFTELIDDKIKPITVVPIDENYREDDEDD